IQVSDTAMARAFERFKRVCDIKKQLTDRDIEALVMDEQDQGASAFVLNTVAVVTGNGPKPSATVTLLQQDRELIGTETGEGSVDAIYNTVDALIGEAFDLVDYVIHSVTGGTDAIAEVTVRLQEHGQIFVGRGAALDVLVASAKAYVNAINQLRDSRE
ncbi:MAG: alpha-isopropylmalate synthase regulatory domain-containing protein, partial [Candidatus Marinamargulisbacteria bacterium]|nr:alpha-isopropylmalate synthase regulatory domain-containing protein [Candidatus Marinamargulisbacteria bacterium]